jgi:hypothetical protein
VPNSLGLILGSPINHVDIGAASTRGIWARTSVGLKVVAWSNGQTQAAAHCLSKRRAVSTTLPLARWVTEALDDYVEDESDVILSLAVPRDLDPEYAKELIKIGRRAMRNDTLLVEVHCIREF